MNQEFEDVLATIKSQRMHRFHHQYDVLEQ